MTLPTAESLFEAWYPRLVGYARRFVDSSLAEDVAQEVFVRLLQYRRDSMDSLDARFLFVMARNVARRAIADRRRESGGDEVLIADREDSHASSAETELLPSLMRELSPRQREAIELTAGRGLSDRQAGLVLSTSRSAVSERCRVGLEQLRKIGACRRAG